MKKIKCGYCLGKSKQSYKGCQSCGGYGFTMHRVLLNDGNYVWMRPGAYTIYDGKEFQALCGTIVRYSYIKGEYKTHRVATEDNYYD